MGATVGSVMATKGAICPAAVGVDIGCGMAAVKTSLRPRRSKDASPTLRASIERGIPVGFHQRKEPHPVAPPCSRRRRDADLPSVASEAEKKKAALQCGTLGGGNHFIEICVDEDDARVWVLLHSGSRNIGKVTAERHIGRAKGVMKRLAVDLPDPDLAYFATATPEFDAYVRDSSGVRASRASTARSCSRRSSRICVTRWASSKPRRAVNCHHNYVAWERHFGEDVMVTRKGAIRAGRGDLGIIPGSMGTGSFIVRGLGNPESFESAPHGAGRKMSRGEARRRFTREDLARQTEGVECRKEPASSTRFPEPTSRSARSIENSSDLVEVVARLKQVVCVKG